MATIEQPILISQVPSKVSTKKAETATPESFSQRRHAATAHWPTSAALPILKRLLTLRDVFICSSGRWNSD